ncbi:MAG: hypothetical protein IPP90_20095 [Gemmatimonadaceae bacterium]|nr:hypothetical protein [Gemmatimonadaceae bacterium]
MTLRPRSLLLLAALVSCDGPVATRPEPAYDPTVLTGGLLYRWSSGKTIRVWIVPTTATTSPDLGVAVRLAMSRWNDVRQFAEYTLTAASSIGDADILVFDRESTLPIATGSCPFDPRGSAGYTYFCPGSGEPRRAERLAPSTNGGAGVSVVIRVDRGRVGSQSGYNAVMAHEFGHALGIGAHSDEAADLMFGLPSVEIPSARDRATLRFLLGRPPGLTL